MAVIQHLPNEILALIFEELYWANRIIRQDSIAILLDMESEDIEEWESSQLKDPGGFPWALCCVCQLWRDIAARHSHFWTRIVFDVGASEPLPTEAFSWVGDEAFELVVFNSQAIKEHVNPTEQAVTSLTTENVDITHEQKRTAAVMEALAPHLARCTSVEFDLKFASSIPPIAAFLRQVLDQPSQLENFIFNFRHQNFSRNIDIDIPSNGNAIPTRMISLKTLCLSVAEFVGICRLNSSFLGDCSLHNSSFDLTLYQYEFCGLTPDWEGFGTASIGEFLMYFGQFKDIGYITLRNLSVRSSTKRNTVPMLSFRQQESEEHRPFWNPTTFWFENISEEFLQPFFDSVNIYAESGTIKNCKFPCNATSRSLGAASLTLVDLAIDSHLNAIFPSFRGLEVEFESCHVDDDVIDSLASRDCGDLQSLSIDECDGYSIQALKNLVIKRRRLEQDSSFHFSALTSIHLQGDQVQLSVEDQQWFSQNLDTFVCD